MTERKELTMARIEQTTYQGRLDLWNANKSNSGYSCQECGLENPKYTVSDALDGTERCFRCFMQAYKELRVE